MPAVPLALRSPAGRLCILGLRLLVAGVFAWAAIPKIMEPGPFSESIANYHLLPDAVVGITATIVPVLELVVAAALVTGAHARGAALCAGVMLAGFSLAMGQAMARGIDINCGCFGSASDAEVGLPAILRNLGLMAACAVVVAGPDVPWLRKFNDLDGAGARPDNP